jgi:hypothetical protein
VLETGGRSLLSLLLGVLGFLVALFTARVHVCGVLLCQAGSAKVLVGEEDTAVEVIVEVAMVKAVGVPEQAPELVEPTKKLFDGNVNSGELGVTGAIFSRLERGGARHRNATKLRSCSIWPDVARVQQNRPGVEMDVAREEDVFFWALAEVGEVALVVVLVDAEVMCGTHLRLAGEESVVWGRTQDNNFLLEAVDLVFSIVVHLHLLKSSTGLENLKRGPITKRPYKGEW